MKNSHRHPKIIFLYVINELNKLNQNIRSSTNYHVFRNAFLNFVRLTWKVRKIFNINDPFETKMLSKTYQKCCHFYLSFCFTFQSGSFIRYFAVGFLLWLYFNFYVPIFRSSMYLVGHCSIFLRFILCFCVNI